LGQFITIELFGQSYTFKAEAEDCAANQVADLLLDEVSKVETQLAKQSSPPTKQTILILAALNIAGEHYKLKEKYSDMLKDSSERSANLIRLLDGCL